MTIRVLATIILLATACTPPANVRESPAADPAMSIDTAAMIDSSLAADFPVVLECHYYPINYSNLAGELRLQNYTQARVIAEVAGRSGASHSFTVEAGRAVRVAYLSDRLCQHEFRIVGWRHPS